MPTMANITVKKNDGTTDIAYTALAGSSGESVPAFWRNETSPNPPAFRPSLKFVAKPVKNGSSVKTMETLYVTPIVKTDEGVTTQVGVHTTRVITSINFSDAQAAIDEHVSQGMNLHAATLIKAAQKEGFAPRG